MLKQPFRLAKLAIMSTAATLIAGATVQAAPICSVSWHPSICRIYHPHKTSIRSVFHRPMHRHHHKFISDAAGREYDRYDGYVEPSSSMGQDAPPTRSYIPAYPAASPAPIATTYPAAYPPVPAPALGPTYNFYGPTTNFFGPPPPLPITPYRLNGLARQNYDRLDPWHGYDAYNGPENGY